MNDFHYETVEIETKKELKSIVLPSDDAIELIAYKSTIREIYIEDCYKIFGLHRERFSPNLIVDIGAQIGVFTSLASTLWPESKIFSFEPFMKHFWALVKNCPPNCIPINLPVLGGPTSFYQGEFANEDEEKWIMSGHFFDVGWFRRLFKNIQGPRLLKIDCEGGEVSILPDMMKFNEKRFDVITGEWHQESGKKTVIETLSAEYNLQMNYPPDDGSGNYSTFFATLKK